LGVPVLLPVAAILHNQQRLSRGDSQARAGRITDPNGSLARRIGDVHLHTILMLAGVALIWLFVGIVVGVTWLQRRGRLGDADRQVSFAAYGPVLAAAFSGGAAGVHLTVIGEHALRTGAGPAVDTAALLCSIGASSAHFASVDASIAGFLPLGVASIASVGFQGAFAIPRIWRSGLLALVGIAVTAGSIVLTLLPRIVGLPQGGGSGTEVSVGYADVLSLVFEAALLAVAAILLSGRPRRLLERLRVRVADAYVATGLGVAAVAVFTVAAVFAGHAAH
jgi:hypothetical protein